MKRVEQIDSRIPNSEVNHWMVQPKGRRRWMPNKENLEGWKQISGTGTAVLVLLYLLSQCDSVPLAAKPF